MLLQLELTDEQADDLSVFLKRCYYADYIEKTCENRADSVAAAIYTLQTALADKGFNPR